MVRCLVNANYYINTNWLPEINPRLENSFTSYIKSYHSILHHFKFCQSSFYYTSQFSLSSLKFKHIDTTTDLTLPFSSDIIKVLFIVNYSQRFWLRAILIKIKTIRMAKKISYMRLLCDRSPRGSQSFCLFRVLLFRYDHWWFQTFSMTNIHSKYMDEFWSSRLR